MNIKNYTIQKFQLGSSPAEIDDLAHKVLTGEKTATSSLLDYYLLGLKKACSTGDCFSVLNSLEKEVTAVRIEKIEIVKLGDITEKFAKEEGDGNLENWQAIHHPYYTNLLSKIGKKLNKDTLLVCEWFKVV